MTAHEYDVGTNRWRLRLNDNSTVSSSSYHLFTPIECNGFVVYAKWGPDNAIAARKIATGVETAIVPYSSGGGALERAQDGRYVIVAQKASQGKQFDCLDVLACIFDTQAEQWLDFVALGQPTLNIFRVVGSGQRPRSRARCSERFTTRMPWRWRAAGLGLGGEERPVSETSCYSRQC